mmetsp:Transcript_4613/g.7022  ORF Transcript_4613/g.7022 Transcript_4613/m.7022 type:complete len:259 (+) Transcript_4613:252-1028(+)|eukprot:CAMPEP_0195302126 /NCGR_PEP_ID=MMETSP0707-20130614/30520_1 /TAXON_ID=33640 /ORGANISM="Asterionellopsis glacialis, Strain CCMP134" /LENGTH=258 /DNA_ID=CAMNT_0040365285 /DNA_START=247 /DNA_END=1023 /DNA_ORIENTATION=-
MIVVNPPNQLWSMLRRKKWEKFVYNTDEASVKIVCPGYSLFPLHFALVEGAPAEIIDALLKSYPKAAKHHFHHDLPIHIAIKQKRNVIIIHSLLSAYPNAIHKTCKGEDLMILVRNNYGSHDPVTVYFDGEIAKPGSASLPTYPSVTHHPTVDNLNTSHHIVEQLRDMQIVQEQMMSTLSDLHDKQSLLSDKSTRLEEAVSEIVQTLSTIKTSIETVSTASKLRASSAKKEELLNLRTSVQTEFQAVQALVERFAEVK